MFLKLVSCLRTVSHLHRYLFFFRLLGRRYLNCQVAAVNYNLAEAACRTVILILITTLHNNFQFYL